MTVFVVALLQITDHERYGRYVKEFVPTLWPFGGVLLAADTNPEPVEDSLAPDKVVLLRFPDRKGYEGWVQSEAYERIAVDRKAGTRATILVVKGLGS